MRKLSLQWRLTLIMMALAAAACLLLAGLFCRSARIQMVDLADFVVDASCLDDVSDMQIEIIPELKSAMSGQLQNNLNALQLETFLSMLGVVALTAVSTYLLAGRVLAPLHSFTARLDAVQAQNLSEPLPVPATDDEIARLTRSYNRLQERLHCAFDAQRRFSANAAHELRTPLAVLQTGLDVLNKQKDASRDELSEGIRAASAQTARLSHLIEELLEMTRLETIQRSDRVSLRDMVEEILCDLDGVAAGNHVELCQSGGDAALTANDALLYRALYNLVENAIKYNRPGGSVVVDVQGAEGSAAVTVTDTGIGIPEDCREQIFAPFFRVDKSRSRRMGGAGLGLALAQAIVRQHGGRIEVVSSSDAGSVIRASFDGAPQSLRDPEEN
jgi:signal transduction histidine kinase